MERKKARTGIAGLLENENIRRVNVSGDWLYSALDLIAVLCETDQPGELWTDIKRRNPSLLRLIDRREFHHPDGTVEPLEVLSADGVFRAAQSVDSPRAERVRMWLAEAGRQRLDEADNPELAILRARHDYERKGHDRRWVDKRLRGMSARQELTSEWARRGATESDEYRELTNRLMESAFGMDVETYRRSKNLTGTNRNLRDHMSDLELVLTMLGETAAVTLHRQHGSQGFEQLLDDVRQAGQITSATRAAFRKNAKPRRTGKVATPSRPGNYAERTTKDPAQTSDAPDKQRADGVA